MTDKIENYPFLQWDIKKLICTATISVNGSSAKIHESDASITADQIIQKVTDFINENYTPRS